MFNTCSGCPVLCFGFILIHFFSNSFFSPFVLSGKDNSRPRGPWGQAWNRGLCTDGAPGDQNQPGSVECSGKHWLRSGSWVSTADLCRWGQTHGAVPAPLHRQDQRKRLGSLCCLLRCGSSAVDPCKLRVQGQAWHEAPAGLHQGCSSWA